MASGVPVLVPALFAANGVSPASGAKIFPFVKGTSTPLATYVDEAITTPAAHPVVANSLSAKVIYLDPARAYDLVAKTSDEATTLFSVTYNSFTGNVAAGTGVADILIADATDPDGIYGAFVPFAYFGAVGDGVTSDQAAYELAIASGLNVIGENGSSYLLTTGASNSAGTSFINCHFKLKVGTGGFTSLTDNIASRYALTQVAMLFDATENGGDLVNCTWQISGATEVAVMAVCVKQGTETKPVRMLGVNRFKGFTGFNAIVVANEIGAAGFHADTLQFESTTCSQGVSNAYFTSTAGSAQLTALSIDGDVSSHHSKNIHIKRVVCPDSFTATGYAWVDGPQLDLVTIACNFSGVTQVGRQVRIDEIYAQGVMGEVIDAQGLGWSVGRIYAKDCIYAAKAVHGSQGVFEQIESDSCAVTLQLASSSFIAQAISTRANVKARNPCKYIIHSGTAQAGGATTITLASAASTINDFYYKTIINVVVRITGGTGSGQSRVISDYVGSTRVATVSVAWSTNPDATSTYELLWGDNRAPISFGSDDGTPIGGMTNNVIEADIEDGTYQDFKVYSAISSSTRKNTVIFDEPDGRTAVATGPSQSNTVGLTYTYKNQGQWRVLASSSAASSITGTVSETTLGTVTVPANAMGRNGLLRVTTVWSYTESANNKTLRVNACGANYMEAFGSTSLAESIQHQFTIQNQNSAAVQVGFESPQAFTYSGNARRQTTQNTTAAHNITWAATLANTGETITLVSYLVEVCYKP